MVITFAANLKPAGHNAAAATDLMYTPARGTL